MTTSSILPSPNFPSSAEIQQAMQVAGNSIEGADYLLMRIKTLANESKALKNLPDVKAKVIQVVQEFVDFVRLKLNSRSQPWSGEMVETSELKKIQQSIAEIAVQELEGKLTDVNIDYAISNDGQYIRGYSSNNHAVDANTTSSLDKLFNAWLANQGYIIRGGYIYPADDTQQQNKLSTSEVSQLIAKGGLQEYLATQRIKATMQERDYPGEEKEARVKEEVRHAIEEIEKIEPEPSQSGVSG